VSDTVHNLLVSNKIIDAKKINVLPKKTVAKAEEPAAPVAEAPAEAAAEPVAETTEPAPAEAPAEDNSVAAEEAAQ